MEEKKKKNYVIPVIGALIAVVACVAYIVMKFASQQQQLEDKWSEYVLSATQNAKSGKPRDKPKLSGINQHKADCYAVCCVSQVVYPARCAKVSCQKNRCVFAPIFLYLLKRRSVLNNRFKLF